MGEMQGTLFSPDFNHSVVVEARPERLSSDAGALLMRDLTDRLGLPDLAGKHLDDPRDPDRISHPFLELLRTWVLLLVHGWSDQNDVELLRRDPVLRLAVSTRKGQSPLRPAHGRVPEELCS
jgi:Transposase DDE domain group 1